MTANQATAAWKASPRASAYPSVPIPITRFSAFCAGKCSLLDAIKLKEWVRCSSPGLIPPMPPAPDPADGPACGLHHPHGPALPR